MPSLRDGRMGRGPRDDLFGGKEGEGPSLKGAPTASRVRSARPIRPTRRSAAVGPSPLRSEVMSSSRRRRRVAWPLRRRCASGLGAPTHEAPARGVRATGAYQSSVAPASMSPRRSRLFLVTLGRRLHALKRFARRVKLLRHY